jgi:hypothetical protein
MIGVSMAVAGGRSRSRDAGDHTAGVRAHVVGDRTCVLLHPEELELATT